MKKLLALLGAIILCMACTACVSVDIPTKEQADAPSKTTVAGKEEIFGLNETAVFDNLKFTASELKESTGSEFLKPDEGKVYVGVQFTVENISDEEQTISSLLLFEGYADDVKCDYSFGATSAFGEGTIDGSLAPGKKMVGWYGVEVPENWSTIELNVKADWLSEGTATFAFNK